MVNIVKKQTNKNRQHHHDSSHPSCHVYKQPFSAIVVIPSNISTGHPQNMIKPLDHSILMQSYDQTKYISQSYVQQ